MSVKARDLNGGNPIKLFKSDKQMDDGTNKHFVFFKYTGKGFHPTMSGILGIRVSNNEAAWQWSGFENSTVYGWEPTDTIPQTQQRKVLEMILRKGLNDLDYSDTI